MQRAGCLCRHFCFLGIRNFAFSFSKLMLNINNLSFYFGGRAIFEDASLQVKPKDKIGLIGLNGKGKSTLLKLIAGEYQPDEGSISKSGDCTIGFLNQDLLSYQTEDSILNVAMQGFERQLALQKEIEEVLHEMETHYRDELVDKLGALQHEFDLLDGYSIQSKAEEILEGLGFRTEDLNKPLKEFSGGWRMRVMLAKLLLSKPSVLMLDEPTNHLDMQSVNILVQALEQYEGTYVVVSHDRHFISQVSKKVWYIEDHEIKQYPGSYEEFVVWMEDQGKTLDEPVKRASKPAVAEPTVKKTPKPEADTKKLEKEIAQIEEQIEAQEQLKAKLELELAEVFSDEEKLKVVNQRYEEAGKKLEALHALWEEKVTALDS